MLTPEQLAELEKQYICGELQMYQVCNLFDHIDTQAARIADMEQRLAAAEQDAARYRWLLNQSWFQEACERYDLDDGGLQYKFDLLIGELIDNAME